MAFFDKINNLAKNISDKTSDAIETGKLNSKANAEKNLAAEDLKKIGEVYYNIWLETGEAAPGAEELFQSAKGHYDAAEEALAEVERIRAENEAAKAAAAAPASEGLTCTGCGAVNPPGTRFCSNCGTKLEAPSPAPEPEAARTCSACGAPLADGMKFCGECGAKNE